MNWFLEKLGFSARVPFDIGDWVNELQMAFPTIKWDINIFYSNKIKCFEFIHKVDNLPSIKLFLNDCSGIDIFFGEEIINEQLTDINEVIREVKELLS